MSTATTTALRGYDLNINLTAWFHTETCCNCGLAFAMEMSFYKDRLADKKSFYCPAGHSQHYLGKSEEQKLREQLASTEQSLKWTRAREEAQRRERRAAERSANAYKGHATRLRNRIANGVCPVQGCQRSFQDVRRHIESKHPEWAHEHAEVLSGGGL